MLVGGHPSSDFITVNSFTGQTKDYFVYRIMFKYPYSSARYILHLLIDESVKE